MNCSPNGKGQPVEYVRTESSGPFEKIAQEEHIDSDIPDDFF